ncbi:uncharacterized protein LOC121002581 [Bufo bufo]|uniref:uncharacterized protein LOC121002581 n=1 Tax=Bufo bufo TaxID=8384 RepID=UPI001ABE832B|nr:uncharacterized protein LOC121002581 [Bufo bufo]
MSTFSYNEEERERILSQVTTSRDFLQVPTSDIKSRDLEKESRRLINHQLHSATLAEYIKEQRIPRGLRMTIRPTLFKDDPTYCDQFQQILNRCSFDLMTLTVSFLQTSIQKMEEQIRTAEQQLQATLPTADYNIFKEKLSNTAATHKRDIESMKRKKFQRDAEDYRTNRVYKWQNNYPRPPLERQRDYLSSSDSSISSHDSRYRSDNLPPNHPGPRRNRSRRGRQETAGAYTGRTTRSQSRY